jgi:hypothetical protein
MQVDVELRESLSHYCLVTKLTQAQAANVAIREMLQRIDNDPVMKARIERAKELQAAMNNL